MGGPSSGAGAGSQSMFNGLLLGARSNTDGEAFARTVAGTERRKGIEGSKKEAQDKEARVEGGCEGMVRAAGVTLKRTLYRSDDHCVTRSSESGAVET